MHSFCAFVRLDYRFLVFQVGAPHRGRLNMLVTLLRKPAGALFAKMNDADSEFHVGDVKYHAGEAATLAFEQDASSSPCISFHL